MKTNKTNKETTAATSASVTELSEFTDAELIDYVGSLPARRRDAILIAVQVPSLAGRPLH